MAYNLQGCFGSYEWLVCDSYRISFSLQFVFKILEDSTKLDNDEKDVEIEEDDCEFQSNLDDFNVEYIIQPRWPTKVFAAECVRKIIRICEKNSIHFNLKSAKDYHSKDPNNDYLVLHLSELVRMAFMAATSSFDQLRLEGLKLLFDIIEKFSRVRELEFHDHLILEQYQAQVIFHIVIVILFF